MPTQLALAAFVSLQIAAADVAALLVDDPGTRTRASERLAAEVERQPTLLQDRSVHERLIAALERENEFGHLDPARVQIVAHGDAGAPPLAARMRRSGPHTDATRWSSLSLR